jgi:tetratricopeptide (TPR) repeat protein
MKLTGSGVSLLAALDQGAYRDAIARFETSQPTDDAVETIWRAEVMLYLERLDEARAELDRLGTLFDRDLTNRIQTIRAEVAFWDKAIDEARELISPVIQSTWEAGDLQGHLRATLLRGRCELRQGKAAEALDLLKEPRRLATVLGNDYYAGIIAHCRAFGYYYLGEYKQTGHAFAEALHLLKRSEGLRWETSCRILYATYLAEVGRYEDSLAECDHCERASMELGLVKDALLARNSAAGTLFMLKRYDEVVARLEDLLDWERTTQHVYVETRGLITLAAALGELGRFEEAERAASEAVQLARLCGHDLARLDAEIAQTWAAGRMQRPDSASAMERIVEIADADGNEMQKCEARLYAADVLRATKPDVARRYCDEALAFKAVEESAHVRNLFVRVERSLADGPIRLGIKGELIIDPSCGWPEYDQAVETLKRFLVLGAVSQSEGNRAEAARKLGLTRSRLHDLWRQVHGEPPRPLRPRAGAATTVPFRA